MWKFIASYTIHVKLQNIPEVPTYRTLKDAICRWPTHIPLHDVVVARVAAHACIYHACLSCQSGKHVAPTYDHDIPVFGYSVGSRKQELKRPPCYEHAELKSERPFGGRLVNHRSVQSNQLSVSYQINQSNQINLNTLLWPSYVKCNACLSMCLEVCGTLAHLACMRVRSETIRINCLLPAVQLWPQLLSTRICTGASQKASEVKFV